MRKAAGSWLAIGFVVGLGAMLRRGWAERPDRAAAAPANRARGEGAARTERHGDGAATPARDAEPDLSDDELLARVRERVAIPADVELNVEDGAVVLFGRVPRYLARTLLERVAAVEGVSVVENRLTPVDFVQPERPPGPPDRP
jgi:BON domain